MAKTGIGFRKFLACKSLQIKRDLTAFSFIRIDFIIFVYLLQYIYKENDIYNKTG